MWCRLLAARHRRNGACWNGVAYWQHGIGTISCRRAGRGLPAMAGRNGAADPQHRPACDRRPAGTAPPERCLGMVPPIGGTVYGGTVWCRLSAARCGAAYRRHGRVPGDRPARSRGAWQGPAGPCGDARGASWFQDAKASCFRDAKASCFRHGVRCRLWPARRLAGPGGIRPGGTVPAGTVPGITAPGMVPPSMVPPDIVPPIGGTILGGTVSGGTVSGRHGIGPAGDGAGNGRHDIPAAVGHPPPPWGRRHAAPPSRPAMAGRLNDRRAIVWLEWCRRPDGAASGLIRSATWNGHSFCEILHEAFYLELRPNASVS